MKTFLLITCLFGAVSLMGGCVSTQTTVNTPTVKAKAHAKPTQSSGTYYRSGIGLGVVAF